jgi:coatomer subunit beta'
MLRNGLVAVKRIRNDRTIREKTFQQEVTSLLHVSHKNIVRFLGFCSHTIHKALLYEGQHVYAENRDRLLCFEYINNQGRRQENNIRGANERNQCTKIVREGQTTKIPTFGWFFA